MTVTVRDHIDAPIERVWEIVSDFGGLMRWHPHVVRCDATGNQVGSTRTVHFADWWAEELLTGLDPEAHVVEYAITACSRPENIDAKGAISLTSMGPGRTAIAWLAGHEGGHVHAAAVNAALQAYYPTRIGHLKAALGLPG